MTVEPKRQLQYAVILDEVKKSFDGHDFAHQALAQNAAAIIVNRPLPLPIAQ